MHVDGDGDGRKQHFRERRDILRDNSLRQQVRKHFPEGRWTRRHWLHASLFTTMGVLIATIIPGFSSSMESPAVESVATHSLTLPALPDEEQLATSEHYWSPVTVAQGQTLGAIFEAQGIPVATLHQLLDATKDKQALTRLRPGTILGFDQSADGSLRGFRYDRNETQRIVLSLDGDKVTEQVIERPMEVRTAVVSGEVGRSLFHTARRMGLSGNTINSLTDDIFKYDIDFSKDVASSDRFSVVVEQHWREGELIRTGPVIAALFTAKGKPYTAIRFERDGKPEYFTEEGRPLKKSFIRSPIQYARLSSRFGARRHPVLGTQRMHKGVDYAAPTGTPIMAAGAGRVVSSGWQGGYGNTVVLDHGKGYTTLYAHMSRTAGLKRGQSIKQGQVIGYVGSTGLSTGPHLHYEFRVNGAHRNPLQHTMPPPEPLSGAQLAAFRTVTSHSLARIRTMEELIFAGADTKSDKDAQVATAKPTGRSSKG